MGTRVLSLWLPYFTIDRMGHEQARLAPRPQRCPRATTIRVDSEQQLLALCPLAERAGLTSGQTLAEALKLVPGLLTYPDDPESDARFLQDCLSWCERYTPFVAVDQSMPSEDGAALWLDIGNAAHLAGGEANLLVGLLKEFQRKGLTARAAIADHPGTAWAACRFGDHERHIVPTKGARVALAPWPFEALRLDDTDCDRLRHAGLDRIEHLYALPRRSLGTRFGDHVAVRLDQALGLVDEPIAKDIPLPAQQAQLIFADPVTDADALPSLIERLLLQLCIGLEAAGLGVKRLTLALYRVDNSTVTCSVGSNLPTRDVHRLSALIGDRFDHIDLGFGLERAILDAVEIEPLLPESIRWRGLGTNADDVLPDLARCDRPKRSDFGINDNKPWAPGRIAAEQAPARPLLGGQRVANAAPALRGGRLATAFALSSEASPSPALQETLPRPLRLLRQPEPIEAIASLPDEPPVLFRWRQRLHKVINACGPETVAPDWWRSPEKEPSAERQQRSEGDGASSPRDYFAVEDDQGARFWLFREGRYDAPSTGLPRWFLHGVFS